MASSFLDSSRYLSLRCRIEGYCTRERGPYYRANSVFVTSQRLIQVFLRAKNLTSGISAHTKTKIFLKETKEMLKHHWLLCIYAVLLMTGRISSLQHNPHH